jgi:hypothetical protein
LRRFVVLLAHELDEISVESPVRHQKVRHVD